MNYKFLVSLLIGLQSYIYANFIYTNGCNFTDPMCLSCNKDVSICDQCTTDFGLFDNQCSSCGTPFCEICAFNSTNSTISPTQVPICKKCFPTFGLNSSGLCQTCQDPNCFECYNNTEICETTYASFITCRINGCLACDPSGIQCLLCSTYLKLNNDNQQCITDTQLEQRKDQDCIQSPITQQCIDCKQGFYLQNQICYQCNDTCSQCINKLICTSCFDGLPPLEDGTCPSPCSNQDTRFANCDICRGEKCYKCSVGYGVSDGKCVQCQISKCLHCDFDALTCGVCIWDSYKFNARKYMISLEFQKAVSSELYFANQFKQEHCEECKVKNCAVCSYNNTNVCLKCDDGLSKKYFLMNNGTSCNEATMLVIPGFTCSISGCALCYNANSNQCQICQKKYQLGVDGLCTLYEDEKSYKKSYCVRAINDRCVLCKFGYLPTGLNYDCGGSKVYYHLGDDKQYCQVFGTNFCLKCVEGYGPDMDSPLRTCQKCQNDCAICENDYRYCQKCPLSFIFSNATQTCKDPYAQNQYCQFTSGYNMKACYQCTSQIVDERDNSKFYQVENECYKGWCDDSCHRCKAIGDQTVCSICQLGYGYQDGKDKCEKCKVDQCSVCSNYNQGCDQCQGGYYYSPSISKCEPCGVGVQQCDNSNSIIKCKIGFVLSQDQKQCLQCLAENCWECSLDDLSRCIRCQPFFSVTGNYQCEPCYLCGNLDSYYQRPSQCDSFVLNFITLEFIVSLIFIIFN